MCLFFLQLQWLLSYQRFCDFSPNKSCKTQLGPMLPPGSRNWQLISPHCTLPCKLFLPFSLLVQAADTGACTIKLLYGSICCRIIISQSVCYFLSLPPQSNIWGQGQIIPEQSLGSGGICLGINYSVLNKMKQYEQ